MFTLHRGLLAPALVLASLFTLLPDAQASSFLESGPQTITGILVLDGETGQIGMVQGAGSRSERFITTRGRTDLIDEALASMTTPRLAPVSSSYPGVDETELSGEVVSEEGEFTFWIERLPGQAAPALDPVKFSSIRRQVTRYTEEFLAGQRFPEAFEEMFDHLGETGFMDEMLLAAVEDLSGWSRLSPRVQRFRTLKVERLWRELAGASEDLFIPGTVEGLADIDFLKGLIASIAPLY